MWRNELKELKSTEMSYSGQCVIRNIKQSNSMESNTEAQHVRNIDKSLQNVDLAIVRQAMRGIGASVIGGFNQDNYSTAANIASATQKASVEITNKAKQDCGVSSDNQKVLTNLVNQHCRNTRRCVIENVEQTNEVVEGNGVLRAKADGRQRLCSRVWGSKSSSLLWKPVST